MVDGAIEPVTSLVIQNQKKEQKKQDYVSRFQKNT